MKKRSKGRLRRFEKENIVESYEPDREFDVEGFLAEGWENVQRQTLAQRRQETEEKEPSEIPADELAEPGVRETTKEERQQRRRDAQKKRRRRIYLAVIFVILVAVGVTVRGLVVLKLEQRELLSRQRELEQRKEELQQELSTVEDIDYIEQQARQQLHMIKPDEILYVFPNEDKE